MFNCSERVLVVFKKDKQNRIFLLKHMTKAEKTVKEEKRIREGIATEQNTKKKVN